MRILAGTVGSLALLAAAACGGLRVASVPLTQDMAWPPGDPRVRLVQVLGLETGSGALASVFGEAEATRRLSRPYGIAWLGDDLVVADAGARTVFRLGADGKAREAQGASFVSPVGVAACALGIVVTDSATGKVAVLDAGLRFVSWLATGLQRPTGVACADESVFVAETGAHRVVVLTATGARHIGSRGSDAGQFNFPTVVAVDGRSLLVGDTLNFRVQRLDARSGAAQGSFGQFGDSPGEMARIKGLSVDHLGRVWVSDAHTDSVSIYDPSGRLLLNLGGLGDAPGRFSFPAGVASDGRGRVAVTDSFNGRVQVFQSLEVP